MLKETIKVEIGVLNRISFALQQNQIPIIYKFEIENISETSIQNLYIKINFSPEFANEYTDSIYEILASKILPASNHAAKPLILYTLHK